jgi:hypothetical protein
MYSGIHRSMTIFGDTDSEHLINRYDIESPHTFKSASASGVLSEGHSAPTMRID